MKKFSKLLGVIALAAIIGFGFTACDNGDDNGGNGGGGGGSSCSQTWTAVADSTFGTSRINAIAYGNNKFVAVGSGVKIAYWSGN